MIGNRAASSTLTPRDREPAARAASPDVAPALAVVIPVHDEAANIVPLLNEVAAALTGHPGGFEIVVVDDASRDATGAVLERARATHPQLRVLRHRRNHGQSAALLTGVQAARARWIATLDGDGQNDPADIPRLWAMVAAANAPLLMVTGHRRKRRDTWFKRASSLIANGVRSRLLGDHTPDTGCGLKIFSRALFLDLPHFDHYHRFLPALVQQAGGTIQSVEVAHRQRAHGRSHYGIHNRLWVGIVDLFGVLWLKRRSARGRPEVAEVSGDRDER